MMVIGAGRVGTSLKRRSEEHGIGVELLERGDWDAIEDGPQGDPIVVATRNDDLLDVIERVPSWRRHDLVLIQNGLIRALVQNNHLTGATRGLLYFAATERGGEIDAGAPSWFSGAHGLTMARWFAMIGLRARAVDWAQFTSKEFEKVAWLCAMGPLCEKHDATVGEVATTHRRELEDQLGELGLFGRLVFNVDLPHPSLVERVVDYSLTIPGYRASVKEWKWRNGGVLRILLDRGVKLAKHTQLLLDTGHGDQIPQALQVRAPN